MVRTVIALLVVLLLTGPGCRRRKPDSRITLPRIMLWAWKRPEDLRFIDSETTGVAPLVGTAFLGSYGVRMNRRLNPLRINDETEVLPVVRIEMDRLASPVLNADLVNQTVESISDLVAVHGSIRRIQIDFDAPLSVRPFYRDLLFALRERAGSETFLSMTALASWCMENDWLAGLPVDEVVPMVFGMGRDAGSIRDHLLTTGTFPSPECRSAFGLGFGRPVPIPEGVQRLYFFSARAWDPESLISLEESARKMNTRRIP